jgi:hypothetical protein
MNSNRNWPSRCSGCVSTSVVPSDARARRGQHELERPRLGQRDALAAHGQSAATGLELDLVAERLGGREAAIDVGLALRARASAHELDSHALQRQSQLVDAAPLDALRVPVEPQHDVARFARRERGLLERAADVEPRVDGHELEALSGHEAVDYDPAVLVAAPDGQEALSAGCLTGESALQIRPEQRALQRAWRPQLPEAAGPRPAAGDEHLHREPRRDRGGCRSSVGHGGHRGDPRGGQPGVSSLRRRLRGARFFRHGHLAIDARDAGDRPAARPQHEDRRRDQGQTRQEPAAHRVSLALAPQEPSSAKVSSPSCTSTRSGAPNGRGSPSPASARKWSCRS